MNPNQYHPINIQRLDNEVISEANTLLLSNQSIAYSSSELSGSSSLEQVPCWNHLHYLTPSAEANVLPKYEQQLQESRTTQPIDLPGLRVELAYCDSVANHRMGNKGGKITVDGETFNLAKVRQIIIQLRNELQHVKVN